MQSRHYSPGSSLLLEWGDMQPEPTSSPATQTKVGNQSHFRSPPDRRSLCVNVSVLASMDLRLYQVNAALKASALAPHLGEIRRFPKKD